MDGQFFLRQMKVIFFLIQGGKAVINNARVLNKDLSSIKGIFATTILTIPAGLDVLLDAAPCDVYMPIRAV